MSATGANAGLPGQLFRLSYLNIPASIWQTTDRGRNDEAGLVDGSNTIFVVAVEDQPDPDRWPMAFVIASTGILGWVNFNPSRWILL